ncbi:MAG: flagellar biosynthesis protein FlhG [Granulosicoccus sp.]|jgi:flagellar biosynthesis protein FlhG
MTNQAQGLAQLSTPSNINVIAVTSGKGGVGKTNIAVNLSVCLAKMGKSVVLLDADVRLGNVDITLGLKPSYDLRHVISGERTLEEILVPGPEGIHIVPASSGVANMIDLTEVQQAGVVRAFSELTIPVDTLIVDTAAGIDSSVRTFASACQDIIVVVCDEPTSITDAYALIKVLNRECGIKRFQLLANMVESEAQGRNLYSKISRVADRFLDVHLGYLGAVPRDDYLCKAVQRQGAVTQLYPRSPSAQAIGNLARTIEDNFTENHSVGGLGFFVERMIQAGAIGAEA